jgi:hypothetical protein
MSEISHSKLEIKAEVNDFSQAQYEKYHKKLIELTKNSNAISVSNSSYVRAAIHAEILSGIKESEIENMKPVQVLWLAREVQKFVLEITTVPEDDAPN